MMNKNTNKSIPIMTDNEMARAKGFLKFLDKRQAKNQSKTLQMKQSEAEKSKSQAIYEAMPKSMQEKMDNQMEILKEKAKTNPVIKKMLESWGQDTPVQQSNENYGEVAK